MTLRLPMLAAALAVALAPAPLEARDLTLWGEVAWVGPTSSALWQVDGVTEFLDPAFPPLGRFDSTELARYDASGDLGVGLGAEIAFGRRLGLEVGVSYTRLAFQAEYGGEIAYTPYRGQPPTPRPDGILTAPITGAGAGRMDQLLVTAGMGLHLLRTRRLDVHAGPLIGASLERASFEHGGFEAVLTWVTRTPLEQREETRSGFAWGGSVGVDVPIGEGHWLVSATARYLSSESLDPALFQLRLGYRF